MPRSGERGKMRRVNHEGGDDRDSFGDDSLLRKIAAAPDRVPNSGKPSLALREGEVIAGRFRLERVIGEGGMGVVWAARHVVTRKAVALKFLRGTGRGTEGAHQRFLREARAACAVRHPSVREVHDVLELDDGSLVMVMDLLEGESFAARLARESALPLTEVARIMVPVCAAVGSAHALGIVHRDSQAGQHLPRRPGRRVELREGSRLRDRQAHGHGG